jgi:hypothetical protein
VKVHRFAKYFPLLEGAEFDLLVADIKANGQLEPIVTYQGEILDGANRWRACEKLGVAPATREYTGDDPLSYVVSVNIRRRHMDVSQRAMLATEMLPEFEKEADKRRLANLKHSGDQYRDSSMTSKDSIDGKRGPQSTDKAAKVFGVSGASVERAKHVKAKAPGRVQSIIDGKETVSAVDAELRMEAAKKRAAAKQGKADDKAVKADDHLVADYLEATKDFKDALIFAIKGAKRDRFAPESKRFVENRHNQLRKLMEELEGI